MLDKIFLLWSYIREHGHIVSFFCYEAIYGNMGISLAVDGIVIKNGRLVVVKRKNWPYKDSYALPGGFVEFGETVESAIEREVREETGLETTIKDLLGVYSNPSRDPRGHMVSIVYALEAKGGELKAGDDASSVSLLPLKDLPDLAFDHNRIMKDFRTRDKNP